nr:MAG TPA: hypothetical protein [Caudoviricetes sp.]
MAFITPTIDSEKLYTVYRNCGKVVQLKNYCLLLVGNGL